MMSGSVHFQMLLNWHGLINCVQHVAFTPSPMKEKSLLTRASPEQLRIHWLSQSRGCRPAPLPPPFTASPFSPWISSLVLITWLLPHFLRKRSLFWPGFHQWFQSRDRHLSPLQNSSFSHPDSFWPSLKDWWSQPRRYRPILHWKQASSDPVSIGSFHHVTVTLPPNKTVASSHPNSF